MPSTTKPNLEALAQAWARAYRARQKATAEQRAARAAAEHAGLLSPARERMRHADDAVGPARKAERQAAERLATALGHPAERRRTVEVDVLEVQSRRLEAPTR